MFKPVLFRCCFGKTKVEMLKFAALDVSQITSENFTKNIKLF